MTAQSIKSTRKPHTGKPYNRKYNRKKVLELAEAGMTPTDIAKVENVAISTVTRYIEKVAPQLANIKNYSNIKADSLCLSQLKKQTIEDILIDNWITNPQILLSQDVRLQKEVIHTMQGGKSYDYEAERLERGLSTQNIDYRGVQVNVMTTLQETRKALDLLRVDKVVDNHED